MAYWIIRAEYIKGEGTNSHIFEDNSDTAFCGIERAKNAKGVKYTTQENLKTAIKNAGKELCGKCSGFSIHTD
ncbi:MAG: hypothetical protein ACRCWI_08720 [Brevinema sp.]